MEAFEKWKSLNIYPFINTSAPRFKLCDWFFCCELHYRSSQIYTIACGCFSTKLPNRFSFFNVCSSFWWFAAKELNSNGRFFGELNSETMLKWCGEFYQRICFCNTSVMNFYFENRSKRRWTAGVTIWLCGILCAPEIDLSHFWLRANLQISPSGTNFLVLFERVLWFLLLLCLGDGSLLMLISMLNALIQTQSVIACLWKRWVCWIKIRFSGKS